MQYKRERKKVGDNILNLKQYATEGEPISPSDDKGYTKTAERLGEQHKVTSRTIYKDAQFAEAVDTIADNYSKDVILKSIQR